MFLKFESQEERSDYGGTAFIEMQFCRMQADADIEEIVSVDNIENWCDDSLYIFADDIKEFRKIYGSFFDCGIHSDLSSGAFDVYGINYYKSETLQTIIDKIFAAKPVEYEVLAEWLNKAKEHNGFYIFGL